jgi:hypothetical protein
MCELAVGQAGRNGTGKCNHEIFSIKQLLNHCSALL